MKRINFSISVLLLVSVFFLFISFVYEKFIFNDSSLSSAVNKASPSVVSISASTTNSRQIQDVGSGVIFSKDGYIVTNTHILNGSFQIFVELNDGSILDAFLIGSDIYSDIAVLKVVSTDELNPIETSESINLKVGDEVLAIGNPYGIGKTVTSGIISATGRDSGNPYLQLIQTDAAINPGNSGGALINKEGNLIGINSSIYSKTGSYSGIGFAIPSEKVTQVATELIKYGKIRTSWIGDFNVRPVRIKKQDSLLTGLQITSILNKNYPNIPLINNQHPLQDEGVIIGDVITSVNGLDATWRNLTNALKMTLPGGDINLTILSKGKFKEVTVQTIIIN